MSFSFQNFGTWPIYDMIFFRYMICYGRLVHFCCPVWPCECSVANRFYFFSVFLLSLPTTPGYVIEYCFSIWITNLMNVFKYLHCLLFMNNVQRLNKIGWWNSPTHVLELQVRVWVHQLGVWVHWVQVRVQGPKICTQVQVWAPSTISLESWDPV